MPSVQGHGQNRIPSAPVAKVTEMIPKEAQEYIEKLMGRSPLTIRNYESFANCFWGFLGDKKVTDVTVDDVMGFLKDGAENKNWKPTTVRQYARITRAFLNDFRDEQFLKKLKKQMRFLPKIAPHGNLYLGLYIPPDKIDLFISKADNEEYAVFYTMMLKWGLRLMEALNFTPSDVDVKRNRVIVRGKGAGGAGKIRQVLVEKSTITRILAFAGCDQEQINGEKQIRDSTPILQNIKKRNAEYKFKETARAAGLKNWKQLHPHSARHSYAIDFLTKRKNQGMAALVLLKNQLGHTSLNVTSIYLDIAGSEAQDVFDAGVNP